MSEEFTAAIALVPVEKKEEKKNKTNEKKTQEKM